MIKRHLSHDGFTLVELLIVIVVIAILAAISIVAYNGMQDRAHATKAMTALNTYVKALALYKVDNGRYPANGVNRVCLGEASQYPAGNGFTLGLCSYFDYTVSPTNADATTTNELKQYMGSLPALDWPVTTESADWGSGYYRGIFYQPGNANGTTATVWYVFRGKHSCPGSTVQTYSATYDHTRCLANLT